MKPLEFRGFHYSLSQGNWDDLPSLRRLVTFAADCGFNKLIFYMEAAWKFRSHPQLARPKAYAVEELVRLAGYAAHCGIDLIPSFSTISHCHYILRKPKSKYRHLAIGEGSDLDVLNPAVYDLFEDMFEEVLPHFRSSYVFLNGDEMNLVHLNERAKQVARRHGLGTLHGRGMGRLARMILKRGRRPIIWHDMLAHHPEGLSYIPKETVIAYWFYDYQPDYPAIRFFRNQGYDVIAASGQMPCCDPTLPDYRRSLPNILGQTRAAARATHRDRFDKMGKGTCLGTMLTLWELNSWWETTLAIYAAGRWARDPGRSTAKVMSDFGREIYGLNDRKLGCRLRDATGEINPLMTLASVDPAGCFPLERRALRQTIAERRNRLARLCARLEGGRPTRNRDIHQRMVTLAHRMARTKAVVEPQPRITQELLSPALVDARDPSCRLIKGKTSLGHELQVLTNGLITVAILPEFGAAMIEWVVLEGEPWSAVCSNYRPWASAAPRAPGDPGLGSPWAACGLGGWRETIFYNARCNPCSLWGHAFGIQVVSQTRQAITIECRGENEVAEIRRRVTLEAGQKTIAIESSATNRHGPCWLALQPNVHHQFPDACAPLLSVVEEGGRTRKSYSLWDHDGTMIFIPTGHTLCIQSPFSKHDLQLRYSRAEIWGVLSQVGAYGFTLEPYGRIRARKTGDTVTLHLNYALDAHER